MYIYILNNNEMKTTNYYGVQLTGIEGMMLMEYIHRNGIAMNTKKPEERKQIVIEFIKNSKHA